MVSKNRIKGIFLLFQAWLNESHIPDLKQFFTTHQKKWERDNRIKNYRMEIWISYCFHYPKFLLTKRALIHIKLLLFFFASWQFSKAFNVKAKSSILQMAGDNNEASFCHMSYRYKKSRRMNEPTQIWWRNLWSWSKEAREKKKI